MNPQEVIEKVAAAAKDEFVVRIDVNRDLNVRWANSTTTTNGAMGEISISMSSIKDGRVGTTGQNLSGNEDIAEIVRKTEASAAANPVAEHQLPLPKGDGKTPADWDDAAVDAPPSLFASISARLEEMFNASRSSKHPTFGYAEHSEATIWLATSAGIRRRTSIGRGSLCFTTKDSDGRSTWGGQWVEDWKTVDPVAMYDTMVARLEVAKKKIDLPAGRYQVILTPSAVADVFTYLGWLATLRDAVDGQSAFSKPGGGTRLGERLTEAKFTLSSDPTAPGLAGSPFAASVANSAFASVFDAGLDTERTDYIRDGELVNLIAPRAIAQKEGLERVPNFQNLLIAGDGASLEEMIASTDRALLVNALWYIRLVDPHSMLLTGLTRDGVYLVEDGKIQGEVNNFRWNVSPLDVMKNIMEIGASTNTLPREFETQLAACPPMRVSDWHMSSVSEAT